MHSEKYTQQFAFIKIRAKKHLSQASTQSYGHGCLHQHQASTHDIRAIHKPTHDRTLVAPKKKRKKNGTHAPAKHCADAATNAANEQDTVKPAPDARNSTGRL
jgi:hypothetical protein